MKTSKTKNFRRFIYLIYTLMMLVTPTNLHAFNDQDLFGRSNIPPFINFDTVNCDTEGGQSSGIEPSPGKIVGGTNKERIYSFFLSKGLTPVQAAGAFGNISQESGGDPTISQVGGNTNDPSQFGTAVGVGKAWGLIQWDAGGRAIVYAEQAGITTPIYLLETQLNLIWWHMTNQSPTGVSNMLGKPSVVNGKVVYEAYKDITDVEKATLTFHDRIEGSSDDKVGLDERVADAKMILEEYGDGSSVGIEPTDPADPGVSTSADPCATDGSGAGGEGGGDGAVSEGGVASIVQTAMNYAWPQAYTTHHYDKMPAYESATQAAIRNGEYAFPSSGRNAGIDCGSYVTRVMRNSGADPTYNDQNAGVAAQQAYLRNSGKYERVSASSTADLRPGDIAIRNGANGYRHTYIYVGPNDYFDGGRLAAEASYGGFGGTTLWLAPQAALTSPYNSAFEYYRLKA